MSETNSEQCSAEVYTKGESVGLFDMKKGEAERLCQQLTEQTGDLHDWHFAMGRVHVKRLRNGGSDSE